MAKRKAMTKAQKAMNAKIKKELQEKGIVPPDKPRLNRKKYIEEAREEWNGRDAEYYAWMCSCIRQSASCSVIQIGTCEPLPKQWEWRRP